VVSGYLSALFVAPVLVYAVTKTAFIVVVVVSAILVIPRIAHVVLLNRRRERFVLALPDSLQQIASSLRAGSTFNLAIEAVVEESVGPISEELSLVLREQRLGLRLDESLENLGDRVNSEEVDITVSAILISQEMGGNLAEVLNRLAETLRKKISMEEMLPLFTSLLGWISLAFILVLQCCGGWFIRKVVQVDI